MLALCKNASMVYYLTLLRWYEVVEEEDPDYVRVINDVGVPTTYCKSRFHLCKTVEDEKETKHQT